MASDYDFYPHGEIGILHDLDRYIVLGPLAAEISSEETAVYHRRSYLPSAVALNAQRGIFCRSPARVEVFLEYL